LELENEPASAKQGNLSMNKLTLLTLTALLPAAMLAADELPQRRAGVPSSHTFVEVPV
jgi:hypothetical protein